MSSRLTTVLAAVGASGALVAGGLAFGGSPAAAADDATGTKTVTYSCSGSLLVIGNVPAFEVPLTLSTAPLAALPASVPSGTLVPSLPLAGSADLSNFVALVAQNTNAQTALALLDAVTGEVASFPITAGQQTIPGSIPASSMTPTELLTTKTLPVAGATKATQILLPAGNYQLSLPKTFGFGVGAVQSGVKIPLGTLTCTDANDAERVLAPVTVTGTAPKPVISAKAPKTAKIGKSVKVTVSVAKTLGGKVTAKLGKKSYSAPLKNGKASVVVKGIKKGVNKIVVSFPKAASKTVKVTGKK